MINSEYQPLRPNINNQRRFAMENNVPVTSPWPMIAGVLVGSALWWLFLCAVVGRLRARFDARWQRRVNHVSAALLAAFALWQWGSLW